MNINSIGGVGAQSASAGVKAGQTTDAQSQSIRKQIEDAQRKLQEISSNGEMSPEEKMKKRQEIQKQISDLNMQLRQHQAEVRRKQQADRGGKETDDSARKEPGIYVDVRL